MTPMKYILTICLSVLICQASLQAQATKQAARTFGISVIQSFFDNNCDYMFDHLESSIKSIQGGQTINITADMRKQFCENNPLRRDIPVNYQMYAQNYAPTVYTAAELNQKFPEWQNNIQLNSGEFLFDGGHPIAAGNKRLFKSNGSARFALKMVSGEWKIIAL